MSLENCKKLQFNLRKQSFKEPNNDYLRFMITRAKAMTTKAQISEWYEEALRVKATHMIVVTDTFDWDDYPVYVIQTQDINAEVAKHTENMQRVTEVYMMSMDKDKQLAETRAYHLTHVDL